MAEQVFTLKDSGGQAHRYELTLHRGSEGMATALQLLSLVIEPLAVGVGPLIVQATMSKGVQAALTDAAMLGSLDLDGLAKGIRGALSGARPSLILDVLRYTNRDGKPLVGPDGKATGAFDEAYARNYAELASALWEACKANAFFPGLDFFASVARKAQRAVAAPLAS